MNSERRVNMGKETSEGYRDIGAGSGDIQHDGWEDLISTEIIIEGVGSDIIPGL